MKLLTIALVAAFTYGAQAEDTNKNVKVEGTNNNVNVCQPRIEVQACGSCSNPKTRTRIVTKIVEKRVEVPVLVEVPVIHVLEKEVVVEKRIVNFKKVRNNIAIFAGYGPKGNLKEETVDPSTTRISTENGLIAAFQYSHDFSADSSNIGKSLYIQGQTNRTFMIGAGIGF